MQAHWPVPLSTHIHPQAQDINPVLARAFQAMRFADQVHDHGHDQPSAAPKPFYASHDQLLQRVDLPEFQQLVNFIADALQKTVMAANAQVWPAGRMALQLQLVGCWFQIQNGMTFHDVHTHGNCSWSGVYYVQVDEESLRVQHPQLGERNGVTRFYGPYSQWQGGAHMDVGNAYLQKNTLDVAPEAGKLVIFPAYLPHMAMPYAGEKDRIIVSFNAQVHTSGSDQLFSYAAQ
jgi:uncharacterized protein (TIGR02466 family)